MELETFKAGGLMWEAIIGGGITLMLATFGFTAWLIRLEGKGQTNDSRITALESRVTTEVDKLEKKHDDLDEKHDEFKSKIFEKLSNVEKMLARIEGQMQESKNT